MPKIIQNSIMLAILCIASVSLAQTYEKVQWVDLLPEEDLAALTAEPSMDDFSTDMVDQLDSPLSMTIEDPITEYEKALVSTKVKEEFNERKVKLPGFIVPLELNSKGKATSFFLVPFFGACIHVPPPPPNQIIYVTSEDGIDADDIYQAYWLEGTLLTEITENEMASSAYSMQLENISEFKDTDTY